MTYKNFEEMFIKTLEERTAGRMKVRRVTDWKNNGILKEGFWLIPENSERPMAARLFYMDELYEQYKMYEGGESMADCIGKVISSEVEIPLDRFENVDSILEWEKIKTEIRPALLLKKWNLKLLKGLVYREYLDFAVLYIIRCGGDDMEGYADIKIRREQLQMWNVSEDELHAQAMRNMEKEEKALFGLSWMEFVNPRDSKESARLSQEKVYTLTNEDAFWGAAVILDETTLRGISGGRNLFIMPSSIHEVILLVDDGNIESESLNGVIRAINGDLVRQEIWLSDHVYYYDYARGEIRLEP